MTVSELLEEIGATAVSVAFAVGPLALLFLIFQLFFLKLPLAQVSRILAGSVLATIGLFLFLLGVSIGFLPFGRAVGESVTSLPRLWMIVPFGVVLGFVTTWGEPSVRVLANQVEDASTGSIPASLVVWTVSVGVAIAVGLGMYRIAYGTPLLYLLLPGYVLSMALFWLAERGFVGIAIDAGGVATGPLANTFLLALALGASAAMGHTDALVSGLGLVALIALAPVMSVTALGVLVRWKARRKES